MRKKVLYGLMFILALMPAIGCASIVHSVDNLVGLKQLNLIRSLSRSKQHPGFPSQLVANQVYIINYLGAAYCQYFVIGSSTASGQDLAKILDRWQMSKLINHKVRWSEDSSGSAAVLNFTNKSHFFSSGSTEVSPIGSLVEAFRQAGYQTFPVVRSWNYLAVSGAGPKVFGGRVVAYDELGVDPSSQVLASASVSPVLKWLSCLWFGFLLVTFLIGFALAQYLVKNSNRPLYERRKIYRKCIFGGAFGGMGFHFIFFQYLIITTTLYKLTDLWTGSPDAGPSILALPLGTFPMLLALPFISKLESKVLIPRDDFEREAQAIFSAKPDTVKVTHDQFTQRSRIKSLKLTIMVAILLLAIVAQFAFRPHGASFILLGFIAELFANVLFDAFLPKNLKVIATDGSEISADFDLSQISGNLAANLGRPSLLVKVRKDPQAQMLASCSHNKESILITQRMLEILNQDELKFVLAREILGDNSRTTKKILYPILLACLLPDVFIGFVIFKRSHVDFIWIAAAVSLPVLAIPFVLLNSTRTRLNEAILLDRQVVDRIGGRDHAISAIKKIEAARALIPSPPNDIKKRIDFLQP